MPASDNPWLRSSGLDRQLGFVLREASVAVWGDLRRTLAPIGLKPQGYATLLIVDASAGCKQQDIADALGIQRANLVALIDGLVTGGWIERSVNPGDRRSYALTLTEAGRTLLAQGQAVHRDHERRLADMLAGMDVEAVMTAAAALSRL